MTSELIHSLSFQIHLEYTIFSHKAMIIYKTVFAFGLEASQTYSSQLFMTGIE